MDTAEPSADYWGNADFHDGRRHYVPPGGLPQDRRTACGERHGNEITGDVSTSVYGTTKAPMCEACLKVYELPGE